MSAVLVFGLLVGLPVGVLLFAFNVWPVLTGNSNPPGAAPMILGLATSVVIALVLFFALR